MGALAFELADNDPTLAVQLIEAVPANWSWIDGQLDAPLATVADGKVARAGYRVDRIDNLVLATLADNNNGSHNTIEERYQTLMYRREAVLELVVNGLMPLFIKFREAGFDQATALWGLMPFESAKRIAAAYAGRGYLGDLFFHSDCYQDRGYQNPEACELHLAPFTEHFRPSVPLSKVKSFDQLTAEIAVARAAGELTVARALREEQFPRRPEHPACIKLAWDPKFGGKAENLASLLAICQERGLKELEAENIGFGFSYLSH